MCAAQGQGQQAIGQGCKDCHSRSSVTRPVSSEPRGLTPGHVSGSAIPAMSYAVLRAIPGQLTGLLNMLQVSMRQDDAHISQTARTIDLMRAEGCRDTAVACIWLT